MNTKLQLISLTLTNVANTDSEVNLLSSPSGANNSLFNTYYKLPIQYYTSFLFEYLLNGVSTSYLLYSSNINDMILNLNTQFLGYAIFSYQLNGVSPNYFLTMIVINPIFVPYSLTNLA